MTDSQAQTAASAALCPPMEHSHKPLHWLICKGSDKPVAAEWLSGFWRLPGGASITGVDCWDAETMANAGARYVAPIVWEDSASVMPNPPRSAEIALYRLLIADLREQNLRLRTEHTMLREHHLAAILPSYRAHTPLVVPVAAALAPVVAVPPATAKPLPANALAPKRIQIGVRLP